MNPGVNLLEADRGTSPQFENAIELVGEGDVVGVHPPREAAGRTDSLSVCEKRFAATELFLRLFPVVDVDDASVPFQDPSVFVAEREGRDDTPAVGMIPDTTRSDLDSICSTGGDARNPDWAGPCSIFGMDPLLPPGASDILRGDARVLEKAEVAVVDRAIGRRAPQHLRNRFRHLAQLAFARLDRALRSLPIFDVEIGAVPFDDGAGVIAQWIGAKQKPPVRSVKSAQPRLDGARVFGLHDPPPPRGEMVHICRVDGGRPPPPPGLLCREPNEVQIVLIEELGGAVWTGRPDKRRNRVDDQPGLTLTFAKFRFGAAPLRDLGRQLAVGRGEFRCPLCDTFIEIGGDSLLQSQKTALLQCHCRFVDRDLDDDGFGFSGKVVSLRTGDNKAALSDHADWNGRDAKMRIADSQFRSR